MMTQGGKEPHHRIEFAYELVLARPPKPVEMHVVLETLDEFRARYHRDRRSAKDFLDQGDSPQNKKLDSRELAAYTSIASLILNLDETVTKQ